MKKNKKQKTKDLKTLFWLMVIIATAGFYHTHSPLSSATASAPYGKIYQSLPIAEDKEETPLVYFQNKTKHLPKELQIEMWDVINLESRWNPKAKNGVSTARGLTQFIFKTWDNYCEGDVYDYKANLDCFLKLYPKHKSWWEASVILGYAK